MIEVDPTFLVEQSARPQRLIDAIEPNERGPRQDSTVEFAGPSGHLPGTLSKDFQRVEESAFVRLLRKRPLRKKNSTAKLAYSCLLDQFEAMLADESAAWAGLEAEGLHQMRVATRQIRAALRAFKSVLESNSRNDFNREFKWLAGVLGKVRDLDVYRDHLRLRVDELEAEDVRCLDDYQAYMAKQWQEARSGLVDCLCGDRYRTLKSNFSEYLQRGPAADALATGAAFTIREAAARLIGKQYQRVLRSGRSITRESPREELHALRIDCKRLRYLFGFFRQVYGNSLKPFSKPLKKLQDVLGELQDAHVAMGHLRQRAERVPVQAETRGQLLALGQLISSERRLAANHRARFHRVWKRFDRRGACKRMLAALG